LIILAHDLGLAQELGRVGKCGSAPKLREMRLLPQPSAQKRRSIGAALFGPSIGSVPVPQRRFNSFG
jgi:hypothetical protein